MIGHLYSARAAWHDAHDPHGAKRMAAYLMQSCERSALHKHMSQAIAGQVQDAIQKIRPAYLIPFGNWLYSPAARPTEQYAAEDLVWLFARDRLPPLRKDKEQKGRIVAKGVLHRYRHMHQGGQGANTDPFPTGEAFRAHLKLKHGLELRSEAWSRDWGAIEQACFDVCAQLDAEALQAVAQVLGKIVE